MLATGWHGHRCADSSRRCDRCIGSIIHNEFYGCSCNYLGLKHCTDTCCTTCCCQSRSPIYNGECHCAYLMVCSHSITHQIVSIECSTISTECRWCNSQCKSISRSIPCCATLHITCRYTVIHPLHTQCKRSSADGVCELMVVNHLK